MMDIEDALFDLVKCGYMPFIGNNEIDLDLSLIHI